MGTENKANKAQIFLLDNNLPDLELTNSKDHNEWLYISDIMMSFLNSQKDGKSKGYKKAKNAIKQLKRYSS